jgi:molybdenum cofactor cytidylyltransferase
MPEGRTFSLGVIILAAGSSSRMGRSKVLLPWEKTTVIGHLIALWKNLPANQIAVVCSATDASLEAELQRLQFPVRQRIVNPDPARGMFSSVQCAARWPGWDAALTHWAIVLGDQPHLRPATLSTLANAARQHAERICQPSRGGRARHPALLPRSAFEQLSTSTEITLKDFLQSRSANVKKIESDDPGLDLDIDYPADYEKARQLSSGK